jgi:hypothetical protein
MIFAGIKNTHRLAASFLFGLKDKRRHRLTSTYNYLRGWQAIRPA